jgi:NAD(P)-dependent dehydrogenase (short-subunit alcohol dehydrogenase family)
MLLEGKTLVVTGGNSGIGEAIVKAAAAEGANVVIDYVVRPEGTEAIVAEIEQLGGHAVGVQADVSKADDLHKIVKTAVDSYGRLDALVNNAGIETRQSILDTTEADYERVMAINQGGMRMLARTAGVELPRHPRGQLRGIADRRRERPRRRTSRREGGCRCGR